MLALAGIVAFSADAEMIRRRPIQQYTLLTLRWTFPARRASGDSICSAERAAMRARVIFISKHQCRLGGDCADLFWPPPSGRSQGDLEPIFGRQRPLEKSWRWRPNQQA
jgi:hypothetical protein